ncbi:hypothetical protein JCM14076_07650 [Methylosoma difficile]
MDFSQLESFLARKNQRFVCIDNGWPKPGPVRYTAMLAHKTTPPAEPEVITSLRAQFPELPEVAAFYSRYGSLSLYCDTVGDNFAFYIAEPDEWVELKPCFEAWLDGLDEEEAEDFLPNWLDDYIVIGEVPQSGNYYLMPASGEDAGKVFLFDHDGFEFTEEGASLEAFIAKITTPNAALLNEILSHTRYWDGETGTQWLADEYLFDS